MDYNENNRLAYLIRKYRTDKKFSVDELAYRANISESNLRRIESGDNGTTLFTLVKIANALDISPACFISNTAPKSTSFLDDNLHINTNMLSEREVHIIRVVIEALSSAINISVPEDKIIGKRICQCRESKGISGRSLAAMIGINNVVLRNMELGNTPVSITVLIHIATALDVSIDYLLSDVSRESELTILNDIMKKSSETLSQEDFNLLRSTYFYLIDGFPKRSDDSI